MAVFTPVPVRVPVPFRSRSTRSCSVHTCKNWPDPFRLRACDTFTLVPVAFRNAYHTRLLGQMSKLLKRKRAIGPKAGRRAHAEIYDETSHDSARRTITNKRQKCKQLNLKHAKHTASIIIPVDMLPRPYTWNATQNADVFGGVDSLTGSYLICSIFTGRPYLNKTD